MQFSSIQLILLVISNQSCATHFVSDVEITCAITPWIVLHSIQILHVLLIPWCLCSRHKCQNSIRWSFENFFLSLLDTQSQKVSYQIMRPLWCWKMAFQVWRISVTLYTRASWKNSNSKSLVKNTLLLLSHLHMYNHARIITSKIS